jgi:hypothetical protein
MNQYIDIQNNIKSNESIINEICLNELWQIKRKQYFLNI